MKLDRIVSENYNNLALIIGNGINRFDAPEEGNSWIDLLEKLQHKLTSKTDDIPEHISLTEFFDILDLVVSDGKEKRIALQEEFSNLLGNWEPGRHHKAIVKWSLSNDVPILTTNFENTLGKAINCQELRPIKRKGLTDFYPWTSYYSTKTVHNPAREFAIWHINGMQRYYRSIRLGLDHYMGSVSRARKWIHAEREEGLFSGKDQFNWKGSDSGLHCIFNNDIFIFGLGLDKPADLW